MTKAAFDEFMEEFRGLQVQVNEQQKIMKKFTDMLTNNEGILNEKLEARLADAVREMSNRAEIDKEMLTNAIQEETKRIEKQVVATFPGLIQTHMDDAKEAAKATCRQMLGENNKVMQDNVDFIKENLDKVKEVEKADMFYMGKLQSVEGEIEDHSKRIANLEVSPGVGEPPTGPSRYRMDDGSEASDERITTLEE